LRLCKNGWESYKCSPTSIAYDFRIKSVKNRSTRAMEVSKVCEEVKLSYKPKVKASERPKVKCSEDIYRLLKEHVFNAETIEYRESVKVILLNCGGHVLGFHTISDGGVTESVVDVKIIMQVALLANAYSIILAHNHPSGGVRPSRNDDFLTEKVRKCCQLMDIKFLDHLIITEEEYYSYADEGRI
jgi:DNA repair protein RadC